MLVEFGATIDDATSEAVVALDRALTAEPPEGLREVVPAFVNILIDFDPVLTDHDRVRAAVEQLLTRRTDTGATRALHRIPVCYDAPYGPDLEAVAAQGSMSVDAVVRAHSAAEYRVAMYGFAPGYAYMAGVPQAIQVPRKPSPVRDVPARSVIIAGPQCLITTIAMPTGWSVIGRAAVDVLRDDVDRPFLFEVGDRVVFDRVPAAAFEEGGGR